MCLEASSCISACVLCLQLLLLSLSLNLTLFLCCFASTRLLRSNFPIPITEPPLRNSDLLFFSSTISSIKTPAFSSSLRPHPIESNFIDSKRSPNFVDSKGTIETKIVASEGDEEGLKISVEN